MIIYIIIIILSIVVIYLIYLVYQTTKFSYNDLVKKINKSNQFLQDLCVHINEEDNYYLLLDNYNYIEGKILYINIEVLDQEEAYYMIINLLSEELANKAKNGDVGLIKKRLEQIAFTIGYLSSQIKC